MQVKNLNLEEIIVNPNQPRKYFDENALKELAESIKNDGLQEPILVRPKGNKFEIVQGERRYRAHKIAGIHSIEVKIKDLSEEEAFHLSVIENIQREQMTAIEEAQAFYKYVQMGYTHGQIAKKVSKNREYVTSRLRLLKLIPEIHDWIAQRKISDGHAKQILAMENTLCRLMGQFNSEETPFEYFQKQIIEEFKDNNRITVNEIRQWIEYQREVALKYLIAKFKGNGVRTIDKESGYTVSQFVDKFQLKIEKVNKDDINFLLEKELKNNNGKQKLSRIYATYEQLEESLFKDGSPQMPLELITKEIKDLHEVVLASIYLFVKGHEEISDITKTPRKTNKELAELFIKDNQYFDDIDILINTIQEAVDYPFTTELLNRVKTISNTRCNVPHDTSHKGVVK